MKLKRARCKGKSCSALILWAEIIKRDGSPGRIPLDVRGAVQVYKLNEDGTAQRAKGYYVTHFATCPDANDFSSGLQGRKEKSSKSKSSQ